MVQSHCSNTFVCTLAFSVTRRGQLRCRLQINLQCYRSQADNISRYVVQLQPADYCFDPDWILAYSSTAKGPTPMLLL